MTHISEHDIVLSNIMNPDADQDYSSQDFDSISASMTLLPC